MKAICLMAVALAGCCAFNEMPYPQSSVTAAPKEKNIMVGVTGFAATTTEIAWAGGYRTVYMPGYRWHPGYVETVPTQISYTQYRPTDAFLRRAQDQLEKAGYSIGAAVPDFTVDVAFAGPYSADGDAGKTLLWTIGTIFFCDYSAEEWTAALRVRDNRSGKLVFSRDYRQRYEANAFGLVPLFSASACEKMSHGYIQLWCLSALTDRAVADATSFFGSMK